MHYFWRLTEKIKSFKLSNTHVPDGSPCQRQQSSTFDNCWWLSSDVICRQEKTKEMRSCVHLLKSIRHTRNLLPGGMFVSSSRQQLPLFPDKPGVTAPSLGAVTRLLSHECANKRTAYTVAGIDAALIGHICHRFRYFYFFFYSFCHFLLDAPFTACVLHFFGTIS